MTLRVLLVEPPKKPWELLGESVMPPLGLAYVAASLRESGFKVDILDCTALKLTWREKESEIRRRKPDVVGVGAITCYSKLALRVARVAKEIDSSIVTIGGGPHFSAMPEEALSGGIDYVVIGEGEMTAPELLKALEEGHDPAGVRGVAFTREGEVFRTELRPLVEDLDTIPMPALDLLPMDRYRLVAWGRRVMIQVSSRGCPFKCTFCSERVFWRGVWRPHSAKRVVDEMELLKERYGRDVIWFGDDTFNVSRRRVAEICREILDRRLDVSWGFEGRADLMLRDLDMLPLMKKAGLFWVLMGVEAASDMELSEMRKGMRITDVRRVFRALRESDIITQAMFIVGAPWDTRESIRAKLKLALELNPDFAIFTPFTPLPGTEAYEQAAREELLVESDPEKYDFAHFVAKTRHLDVSELRKLRSECYRAFYRRAWRAVRSLVSRNRFRRQLAWYFVKRFIL